MSTTDILDLVTLVAVATAGVASTVFLAVYWRLYGTYWRRMSSAWLYIVSLNSTIAGVAASSVAIYLLPDVLILRYIRAALVVMFSAAVAFQVYMLVDEA